jgi:hypothetical protein
MATGFGAIVLDSPEAKIFTFRVNEADAAATETVVVFGANGMTNMNRAATEKIVCEVTTAAATSTEAVTIAVHTPTAFGVTIAKTCASVGVGVIDHVFRIHLHSRPFYG